METLVIQYISEFTYIGIFALLILSVFGFPFPEDAVLLVSGVLVSHGLIGLPATLAVAYTAALTGDLILYYAGLRYGPMVIMHRRFGKILTTKRLGRINRWFGKWGGLTIFFGRYVVGVRAQVLLCSGVLRMPVARMLLYDGLSALIGVPCVIMLGYYFNGNLPLIRAKLSHIQIYSTLALLLLALIAWVYYIYKKIHSEELP